MSCLPSGWKNTKLLEIATLKTGPFGSALHKSDYTNGGIPLINPTHIKGGTLIPAPEVSVSTETALRLAEYRLSNGDIVMGRRGEMGRCAVVTEKAQGWLCGTGSVVIKPSSAIAPQYLQRFLSAPKTVEALIGDSVGSTMINLNQSVLLNLDIPLAPLPEQKRIADKIDRVLARVDACRDRLDRLPALLKRFRQSVLAAATSGRLTEDWRAANEGMVSASNLAATIHQAHQDAGGHKAGNAAAPSDDVHDLSVDMFPAGWELLTLRDVVEPGRPITYGILKPGPELETGIPYIRVADFPGDKLNLSSIRNTSHAMDEEFKRSRLRPGDLLLSIRGTVGRMIVIPTELDGANITQDSARLSIQSAINNNYILWYLRSPLAQERMRGATKGVAVRGINIGDVRALQIPFPCRAEQNEIVRRVETLFAFADRLEARLNAARGQVERLTPALLAKAFRGELVPQDPADEPAAELLKRLAAQRAAEPAGRQRRQRSAGS